MRQGDGGEPVSNFLIKAVQRFTETSDLPGELSTTALECEFTIQGRGTARRIIPESAWNSRTSFLGAIQGIPGVAFFGADRDVQILKYMIYNGDSGEDEMQETVEVQAAGIHRVELDGRPTFVYVEPELSVTSTLARDTHVLGAHAFQPPAIRQVVLASPKTMEQERLAEVDATLDHLMRMNHPATIATLLGWFCAAHLKSHIKAGYEPGFPLLSVWGNAGSGKTRTTQLMALLSGVDEATSEMALNLPGSTLFPITQAVTSTTTVPRLLEEFNRSKFAGKKNHYTQIHELLKAAWDGSVVARGVLGSANASASRKRVNAAALELRPTAPLVVIAEQAPDTPALQQRSVTVLMDARESNQGTVHFRHVTRHRGDLRSVARALVIKALKLSVEAVYGWLDTCPLVFPETLEHRPRWGYTVVWAGLQFLRATLAECELTRSAATLEELIQVWCDHFHGNAEAQATTLARSEVDAVMDALAEMAVFATRQQSGPVAMFTSPDIYLVEGDLLYLDWFLAHVLYLTHARNTGRPVVIDNVTQFYTLLQRESYWRSGNNRPTRMGTTRPVAALSLQAMRDKGLQADLFGG